MFATTYGFGVSHESADLQFICSQSRDSAVGRETLQTTSSRCAATGLLSHEPAVDGASLIEPEWLRRPLAVDAWHLSSPRGVDTDRARRGGHRSRSPSCPVDTTSNRACGARPGRTRWTVGISWTSSPPRRSVRYGASGVSPAISFSRLLLVVRARPAGSTP